MEYRQYSESSRGDHTLHHPRHTNRRNSKDNTIPRHKYRERRHHIRIPMDGRLRTTVHMEKRGHQRKGITHHPPVSEPLHPQKGPDNRTSQGNKIRKSTGSHDFHRTRNSSATIHQEGGSPDRIPTIR